MTDAYYLILLAVIFMAPHQSEKRAKWYCGICMLFAWLFIFKVLK